MEQIGYSLVALNGDEVAHWGDKIGEIAGIPDIVFLPNGDHTHCAKVGDTLAGGYKLLERWATYGSAPGIALNGSRVVLTLVASKGELHVYNGTKFYAKENGGTSVNVGTDEVPIIAEIATHAGGKVDVAVLNLRAQATGSGWTTTWFQSSGDITINVAQLATITNKLDTFSTDLLAVWSQTERDIEAGTIKTYSDIDGLAWPV